MFVAGEGHGTFLLRPGVFPCVNDIHEFLYGSGRVTITFAIVQDNEIGVPLAEFDFGAGDTQPFVAAQFLQLGFGFACIMRFGSFVTKFGDFCRLLMMRGICKTTRSIGRR